jgi:2-dehydropantoate 2-reductase
MRFAVVGAGGVGGYFGGRLAQDGNEVSFVARGAHLDAIRRHGLRVESIAGDFVVDPALATDDPAEVGPVEVVIIAVKAWQLADAAEAARPLVGPDTAVLPLLNGVEASERLAEVLGGEHVLGGLCRLSAKIAAPGIIRHSAIEATLLLGEPDNRRTPRVQALVAALSRAGVRAAIADDIDAALWEKFMLIATWSGIGSVTRAPVGVWRAVPGLRSMAEACLREVLAVAHARNVRLGEDRVAATMAAFDAVPPQGMASMQRDILAGRPSELEAQNGAVVRLGAAARVSTPTHAFIYHCLLPQETAARSQTT